MAEKKELAVMPSQLITIGEEELKQGLQSINDSIEQTLKLTEELTVDDKALAAMDYKDIKRFEQELSKQVKSTNDQRIAFKKVWEAPLAMVTAKVEESLAPAKELHERYKAERVAADERQAEEKRESLKATYEDFLAASGFESLIESIPFNAVWESKWANKSCTLAKAENELTQKVASIIADWQSIQKTQYHYPDDAQLTFFETLNLRDVNERDAKRWEQQQQLEAIKQEQVGNEQFRAEAEDLTPIVAEAEQIAYEASKAQEPQETYLIEAVMTMSQWNQLRSYMQEHGIHGSLKRVVQHA